MDPKLQEILNDYSPQEQEQILQSIDQFIDIMFEE